MICVTCSSKGKFGVRSEFRVQEVGHARGDDAIAVASVRSHSEQKKLASGLRVANGGSRALLAPGDQNKTSPTVHHQ